METKLIDPPAPLAVPERKKRVRKARPTSPPGKPAGVLVIPTELTHGSLICPGCAHKVAERGALLFVITRGRGRWTLAHNAHVELAGENCEVIANAGEYSYREIEDDSAKIHGRDYHSKAVLAKVEHARD